MKSNLFYVLLFAIAGVFSTFYSLDARSASERGAAAVSATRLSQVKTATAFTDDSVSSEDLRIILEAGTNAPSSHNLQPWSFGVITNKTLAKEIDVASKSTPTRLSLSGAPLSIVVSGESGEVARFDCGLAADRMAVAALALGYGTKIVLTPAQTLDKKYRDVLGIPENMSPVAVLLIGKEVDGVSGATDRRAFDETVRFVEPR